MADQNYLKNIAIVGAGGNVGSAALKHLLASDRNFNITILTQPTSTSTFPTHPRLTVQKGTFTDANFLTPALQNQDALLLALGFRAMDLQPPLITAAVSAGVSYILPTEYAGDGLNEAMIDAVPVFQPKRAARSQIAELGGTWIGIATNPWTDQSLRLGLCGLDLFARKATLYRDAGTFNMSTLDQVGLGIARVLGLPIRNEEGGSKRASLEHYGNNFVYISSLHVTQRELFASAVKATGTSEAEWEVDEEDTVKEWIGRCKEMMSRGEMKGAMGLTFAYYLGKGLGGDYQAKAVEDMKVLGLQEGDLDAVVQAEVEKGPMGPLFG
ncbi:hypothetical protein KC319_g3167 [Hortaea werneckii]|nr:hypothetical protein KC352_g12525 [Hortaea werneckii]KAI7569828.1 hypothetical protein KC317_g2986 [Hortaea werneckii]KAI7625295.1 hypothetical protein KC346_g1798 [Hortaea werneckii]KAI7678723.1 hypothetical protein KC319_g3167 [Hortaea werneckii]KAI7716374.1 hypothetical protein KC322_g2657 [Hortaea werneckii]